MNMSYVIALSPARGGVGKSTLSALLVRSLSELTGEIVLAVDADPNANLGDKLGVKVERTIGQLREDLLKQADDLPAGMSKQDAVMYHLRLAMVEGEKFDLVTMGRQEGRGCYCYINNLLRTFLDGIMDDYRYVVIDNEAGMEHLSRRTCQKMVMLVIVPTPPSWASPTARRILELAWRWKWPSPQHVVVSRVGVNCLSSGRRHRGCRLREMDDDATTRSTGWPEGLPLTNSPKDSGGSRG